MWDDLLPLWHCRSQWCSGGGLEPPLLKFHVDLWGWASPPPSGIDKMRERRSQAPFEFLQAPFEFLQAHFKILTF
jgi:hypothetical protein